jgi:aspartyl-tRNA(Asn)/glutamyl-tRNA(Gln) amidotransferase subunit A
MYLSDIYTISANLAGIPGMSVPCGISKSDGMPIGVQLMSKHFDEESLIAVGHRFQQATDHHLRQPPL